MNFFQKIGNRHLIFAIGIIIMLVCLLNVIYMPDKTTAAQTEEVNQNNDVQLLARCVNGEARGEPYVGQVAVAAVILNRVKHPSFPNSLNGVIYQPGAFTATVDGNINVPIDTDSTIYQACNDAMNGWDPTGGAIYYYNPKTASNKWIRSRPIVATIANHVFAK